MRRRFPRFRAGQPLSDLLSARLINAILGELERVGRWRVAAPLLLSDNAEGFSLKLGRLPEPEWFYTTSAIATATASATGTALASATMSDGSGTARRCLETVDSSGVVSRKPDPNVKDVTIYNPAVYTIQIATGSYVRCVRRAGRWEVEFVARCPES